MPIWLRKFTYQQIAEYKQQVSDAQTKAAGKNKKGTNIDRNNPRNVHNSSNQIKPPSYITKASKK